MKQLTPPGIAGIAVLRADPGERTALLRLLRRGDGQAVVVRPGDPPRRAVLQVDGVVVDDVLVVDRGEHGVELHVHGAPATVDALRRVFVVEGARPSSYAEQLLWQAITRAQMELALEQMAFDFDACCASLQAQPLSERSLAVAAMKERTRIARAHVEPRRLVLVGAQNAGKSSLCNTLLFRERVLTGPQPGLTRDPVAECTGLDGYPYELVDAAGEGPVVSAADARAIVRARQQRDGALLLLVVDAAVGPTAIDRELAGGAALVVANKADLPKAPWPVDVPLHLHVSCVRDDPARVRTEIGQRLRLHRGLPVAGRVGGAAGMTPAQARQLDELAAIGPA